MKSAKTGTPILTAFDPRLIVDEANRLGVKIPEPMSISRYEWLKDNNGFRGTGWNGKLLIDNLDCVLWLLLEATVDTATLTSDNDKNMTTTEEFYDESPNKFVVRMDNRLNKILEEVEKMSIMFDSNDKKFMQNLYKKDRKLFDIYFSNEITDVNIIVPNKVVEVTFADGTKQKSVCREPDTFSLETAISICLSKKIMGGSSAYNNAVKGGVKVYEDKLKKIEADKAEQERIAKKKAKKEAYKARRAAKREAAEKEKAIAIQTEAYIRAMEEMENRKNG